MEQKHFKVRIEDVESGEVREAETDSFLLFYVKEETEEGVSVTSIGELHDYHPSAAILISAAQTIEGERAKLRAYREEQRKGGNA